MTRVGFSRDLCLTSHAPHELPSIRPSGTRGHQRRCDGEQHFAVTATHGIHALTHRLHNLTPRRSDGGLQVMTSISTLYLSVAWSLPPKSLAKELRTMNRRFQTGSGTSTQDIQGSRKLLGQATPSTMSRALPLFLYQLGGSAARLGPSAAQGSP
eukprot:scaffold7060_cov280-Pinguiococcus_pyrenoidosus.AAC.3